MRSKTTRQRYGAKLLFQFRVDLGRETGKRRICEERIVMLQAASARVALSLAKKRGKSAEYDYENDEGNRVYFEFVGIMDLLELGIECAADEVWYDIVARLAPMERREKLIPMESQLCALCDEQKHRKHR